MAVEVKVPSVGESVQEGMIFKWHKQSGEFVEMDEVLVELETDKATVDIVAENSGVVETLKAEGDAVAVGDVIARIDTEAQRPAGQAQDKQSSAVARPDASTQTSTDGNAKPAASTSAHLSPAVGRMVSEHQLNPADIAGTGRGGRITKTDVIDFMEQAPAKQSSQQASAPTSPTASGERVERRERMTLMRKKIAERMLHAQHHSAILTTFNEVDMSAVMSLRKQYKDSFKDRHGVGLGFMSFFVKAAIEALKEFPAINGWIEGEEIVYHDYYDVGVAVSSNRGLVVPVIRDADKLSFAGIESKIGEYAEKARMGKITVDELTGGTFTISNGGVFGSLLSTPILNPPQSGILGMHKIEQRAVVIDGQIVARPMMYLALSYDHRIVDGKEAVSFLVKIKDCIEDPSRLLLGV